MQSDGRPSDSDESGSSYRPRDPSKNGSALHPSPQGGHPIRKHAIDGNRVIALVGAVTALVVGCFAAILFQNAMAAQIDRELAATASVHAASLETFAAHRREQLLTFRNSDSIYNFLNASVRDENEGVPDAPLNTIRSVSQAMNLAGGFDTVSIANRDGEILLSTGAGLSDQIPIPRSATGSPQLEIISPSSGEEPGTENSLMRWVAPVSRADGTLLGAVIGETDSKSLQALFSDQNRPLSVQTWVLVQKADQWLAPLRPTPNDASQSLRKSADRFPVDILNGQQSTAFMIPQDGEDRLVVWEAIELTPSNTLPCRVILAADPAVAYAPATRIVNWVGLVTFVAVTLLIALTLLSTRFIGPLIQEPPPVQGNSSSPIAQALMTPTNRKHVGSAKQVAQPPTAPDPHPIDPHPDSSEAPPANEATDADSRSSSAQLDWGRVLKSMGGNPDMLREIALAMQAECPQCMTQIDTAIETDDESLLRRSAHTIKGSLRLFGPSVAQNIATEIETDCKTGDLSSAKEHVPKLRREIRGFLSELDQFLREFDSKSIEPSAQGDDSDSDISWDRPAPRGKPSPAIDHSPNVQNRLAETSGRPGPSRIATDSQHSAESVPVTPEANGKGKLQVNAQPGEYFTVLIIEDSDVDAMVVDQRLKSDGRFKALRLATLQQGCQHLQEHSPPDALILDLNLPDSSGLNTFKTIHQRFPSQPVVVLTGEKDEAQAMEAMREGAQDYVYKSSPDETVLIRALLYAIERNKRRVAEQRQRDVESELELAKQIQQHLLPQQAPNIKGFDVAGRCVSADATSGDLFDFIDHGDGKWDIVLADVCGHGLGPAMITVGARRLLRSSATLNEDVGSLLTIANRGICDDLFGSLFVALFFARLDSEARRLTYVGAGQPAFLVDSDGNGSMLASSGIPTGIEAEFEYTTDGDIDLSGDEILLLMTDGVWEAHEDALNPFGKERAFAIVHQNRHRSSDEIVGALIDAVKVHCQPGYPKDDITVVVIKPSASNSS